MAHGVAVCGPLQGHKAAAAHRRASAFLWWQPWRDATATDSYGDSTEGNACVACAAGLRGRSPKGHGLSKTTPQASGTKATLAVGAHGWGGVAGGGWRIEAGQRPAGLKRRGATTTAHPP